MFRLRYTNVSEFPRNVGSLPACHATAAPPPSSHRTCRFPASGAPRHLDRRHSQGVDGDSSEHLQTQLGQQTIPAAPLRRTDGPLAPTTQMANQTFAHVIVDLLERLPRLTQSEVVRPPRQMPVQFMEQHAVNNPGMYTYHHCAVLQITADPKKPLDAAWPKERTGT